MTYTYTTTGYYETTVVATQNYAIICSSGGSAAPGYENDSGITYPYLGPSDGSGSGSYGSVGDPTYIPPTIISPTIKIEIIDMEDLNECHQDIINDLIGSTQQEFQRIFRLFYGDKPIPMNYNVKFQYGNCGSGATACTSPELLNGWAAITINPNVNANATDLSMARTVMHEILHAYLLFEENYPSDCDLNCLLNESFDKFGKSDYNISHHALFVETKFLKDIAIELKNYAVSIGYNANTLGGDQFFKDLAWGGLNSTNVFNSLPLSDKIRIINTIGAELYNKNYSGALPKGINACD